MNRQRSAQRCLYVFAIAVATAQCVACFATEDRGGPSESASVASPTFSASSTFGGRSVLDDEYSRASEELVDSLPDDARFPSEAPGTWDSHGSFEKGIGEVTAALYWRCAWMTAYVDSADDTSRATALDALSTWIDLPQVAPHIDQKTREAWPTEVIEPARAGDDVLLRLTASRC